MKAECIEQYKQLEGILDKGDEVEIEILKEDDGSFIDYRFKSKNGEYYTGKIIQGFIGFTPMGQIFKKL